MLGALKPQGYGYDHGCIKYIENNVLEGRAIVIVMVKVMVVAISLLFRKILPRAGLRL